MKEYFKTELGALYCGDCPEIMAELKDKSIDAIITDPPYGISLKAQRKTSKFNGIKIANDENVDIISHFLPLAANLSDVLYLFAGWSEVDKIMPVFKKYYTLKNCLVWDKMWFGMGYNWRPNHEFILYGVKGKNKGVLRSKNKGNILRHRRIAPTKLTHIAEKPISLLAEIIEEYEGTILDPFAGSGTTLLAAEKLGRRWIGIELEKKYCEIIKQRFEAQKSGKE